jgi:enoyl-CoA hydratase
MNQVCFTSNILELRPVDRPLSNSSTRTPGARTLSIAVRLAAGAPSAVRWTKSALNNWLRSAGPAFDVSLALEFLGFSGPDVKEEIASIREKRAPNFNPRWPI